jgi:hypothetical protein
MTAQSSRAAISARLFADETLLVKELAAEALLSPDSKKRVADLAKVLAAAVRANRQAQGGIDAFMPSLPPIFYLKSNRYSWLYDSSCSHPTFYPTFFGYYSVSKFLAL